jgi:hypothetical protein
MPTRAGVCVWRHRNDQVSLGVAERRDILCSLSSDDVVSSQDLQER